MAPVFNEAATLSEFVRRLEKAAAKLQDRYNFEFVLVDDGSQDESLEIARELLQKDPRLRVIELRRNFGQTAALQAGFSAARGDIIVSMDSDLQHFPEDLPAFLEKLQEGYDLVCGWRHERREGIVRRWPSKVANKLIRWVSGLAVHDIGTTYRAYRADLVRHLQLLGEQHRFVPALAQLVGARVAEVKIQNIERPSGKSNYGLGRTLNVALDLVFLYFTTNYFSRPLKVFGRIALALFTAGSLISAILIAYAYVTGIPTVREHSGWFLLSMFLMLSALQIVLVGILAEILVRVYYRASGGGAYFVRNEWVAAPKDRGPVR